MYKFVATTLSMLITLILDYGVSEKRASDYVLQYMLADPLRESALALRSWCYYSNGKL